MLRRNFLRNAALTLPVALAAPEMLFAENSKNVKKSCVVIIGAGNAGMYIAAQLAAANKDVLLLEPGNGIAGDAWHNTSPDSDSMPETSSQTKQHELTAAFDKTKILTGKQVIAIACGNKGFTLTDNEGNVYKADKLVCATPIEFSQTKAMVHIRTAASQKLPVSIKRNDSTSAQCWAASSAAICGQLLAAFCSSKKPAIMCIS
jgi:predicted NAD/FAD-dependent oxidoreductase